MSRRRKLKRRKKKHPLRMIALSMVVLALMLALVVGLQTASAIVNDLPKLDKDSFSSLSQTSKIYAADGSLLAEVFGNENRTVVPLDTIPSYLKEATIAIEDERFYEHGGVDYQAIGRALVTDISEGKLAEGGSTITQQLVKKVYVSDERSFTRKIVEAVLATQLERTTSKDEILERYLNTIYYGENSYGVEAAARTYFGKSVSQLDLEECATLAGLPQAPSAFDPVRDIKAATDRRNIVLQKMADLGYINQAEAHGAASLPIDIKAGGGSSVADPYFVEYVKQQLIEKYGAEKVFEGGLKVYTTIDPKLQAAGLDAIKGTLNQGGDPAAALVTIDPGNGYIKAMVSSQDFNKYKFNLAVQAKRQPGSCFKAFVLAAAVEQGVDPAKTYYMSKEINIPLAGGGPPWNVTTFNHKYTGATNIQTAMIHSDNTVFAQLVMDIGPEKARDAAERLGIMSDMGTNPSIALGGLTEGVSPMEMASAYATLADNGLYQEPTAITKVEMPDGTVDYQADPHPKKAVSDGVAYTVTQVLEQDVKATSKLSNLKRPAAGKTGSTQNLQDAWFVGYTTDYSTAVWIGYPDEQIPMTNVHGGQVWGGGFPVDIWDEFMMAAEKDRPVKDFALPHDKVNFKKLQGRYVLYSGGDSPTSREDVYGNTGRTSPDGAGNNANNNAGNGE